MGRNFFTAFLSAYFVVSMLTLVYFFPTPREWVIHMLSRQNVRDSASPTLAFTIPTPTFPILGGISSSSTSASSTTSDSSSSQDTYIPQPTTYQYKIVEAVDPCTLNKLGADGWHAVQFGGTLVQSTGKDENCKRVAIFDSLDWALFEKPSQ